MHAYAVYNEIVVLSFLKIECLMLTHYMMGTLICCFTHIYIVS